MKFVLFAALLYAPLSFAGFLEVLSSGVKSAHTLSVCPDYNQRDADRDLTRAIKCVNESGTLTKQVLPLSEVQDKIEQGTEDRYFAALALQHSNELVCASQFAGQVGSGNEKADKLLASPVRLLRQAKQALKKASESIAKSPYLARVCPLTLTDLNRDFPEAEQASLRNRTACRDLIEARAAYDVAISSIPLANFPSAKKALQSYTTGSKEMTDAELQAYIRKMYQDTKADLVKQAADIRAKAQSQGGSAFSRADRHALLADPRLSEKVIAGAQNSPALQAVACKADGRYGSGAEMLDRDVFVISMVSTGGVMLKAVGAASKLSQAAQAGRAAGFLSPGATAILQVSAAAGISTVATASQMAKACGENIVTTSVRTSDSCADAPSLEKLEQDNCYLAGALSAMEFTGIGAAALKMSPFRIAKNLPEVQQKKLFLERRQEQLKTAPVKAQEQDAEVVDLKQLRKQKEEEAAKAKAKAEVDQYWDRREQREKDLRAAGVDDGWEINKKLAAMDEIDRMKANGIYTKETPTGVSFEEKSFVKGGTTAWNSKAGDVHLVTEEQLRAIESHHPGVALYNFRTGEEFVAGADDFDYSRLVGGKYTEYGLKVKPDGN